MATDSARLLRLTGTVTAKQRARLSPRVSGLVAEVYVDAGDRVDRGDVLLDLDRALAQLAEKRARAALAEARAQQAESARLEAEAATLLADEFIPESEVEARKATLKRNVAAVARLDADAREAREIVERHSVVAPFAGVIARKNTEAGEWVQTGTTVLELVGTEGMWFDVQAPQERFADIQPDTRVEVYLDGSGGASRGGRVSAIVPVHDPNARTFLVRVELEDAAADLVPGMSGEAAFAIGARGGAVTVPRDALVRGVDGDQVWVVEERDGVQEAVARGVKVGRSLAERVEVIEGLSAGVAVVVRGNENLRDGQAVRVLGES